MNKIKKEEMDLPKVSKEIVNLVSVLNNRHTTFDERVESVEKLIKEKIINILEPESVYEKGKYYDGLGKYVGIVDTYPHGADYFVRNHHFAVMPGGDKITGGHVAKINKVKIREIKK
jgi:hypothetical protein